jgi:hypothetical protein
MGEQTGWIYGGHGDGIEGWGAFDPPAFESCIPTSAGLDREQRNWTYSCLLEMELARDYRKSWFAPSHDSHQRAGYLEHAKHANSLEPDGSGTLVGTYQGRERGWYVVHPDVSSPLNLRTIAHVWVIIAIIWAGSDAVNASLFVTLTTELTFGYLLSRGIAKASRVLEQ